MAQVLRCVPQYPAGFIISFYTVISLTVAEYFILWTHDDLFSFSDDEVLKLLVDLKYDAMNIHV